MFAAATWTACIEEPHKRLNVAPGTVSGNPARNDTSLPTLNPCSPSGYAQPRRRSSISSPAIPVRSSSDRATCPAISSGRTSLSAPLCALWNGERIQSTMTAFTHQAPRSRPITVEYSAAPSHLDSTGGFMKGSQFAGPYDTRMHQPRLLC